MFQHSDIPYNVLLWNKLSCCVFLFICIFSYAWSCAFLQIFLISLLSPNTGFTHLLTQSHVHPHSHASIAPSLSIWSSWLRSLGLQNYFASFLWSPILRLIAGSLSWYSRHYWDSLDLVNPPARFWLCSTFRLSCSSFHQFALFRDAQPPMLDLSKHGSCECVYWIFVVHFAYLSLVVLL